MTQQRMTRDELLKRAQEQIEQWDPRNGEFGSSKALFAIACIFLAKEMTTTDVVNTRSGKAVLRIHTDEDDGVTEAMQEGIPQDWGDNP